MTRWKTLFTDKKPLIGMLHVPALPGTPAQKYQIREIIKLAKQEAVLLQSLGFDAIMLENMHDAPYLNTRVGAEITAAMTAVACAIREIVVLPIGIQILAAANREALAVALAAGLDFIRAEGFVFGHLADEGYIDACAGELLRYRKAIGAERIAIFTDIKKKHSSHSVTGDLGSGETAAAAEFFRSDALIVTGTATGQAARIEDLQEVKRHSHLPVLIGSGITADNLSGFWDLADAFIVGSYLKVDGIWSNPLSEERCTALLQKASELRKTDVGHDLFWEKA